MYTTKDLSPKLKKFLAKNNATQGYLAGLGDQPRKDVVISDRHGVICGSFAWSSTKEGHQYWADLDEKFNRWYALHNVLIAGFDFSRRNLERGTFYIGCKKFRYSDVGVVVQWIQSKPQAGYRSPTLSSGYPVFAHGLGKERYYTYCGYSFNNSDINKTLAKFKKKKVLKEW